MSIDITYPRSSGHCAIHHIPISIVNINNNTQANTQELIIAKNYLQSINADLVKGDLIVFDCIAGYLNYGISIYDGNMIIPLSYEFHEKGHLPSCFEVITNNVPINYWNFYDDNNEVTGISENGIVWIDHRSIRNQCIENVTYTHHFDDDKAAVYTFFLHENKMYFILLDYMDDDPNYADVDNYRIYDKEMQIEQKNRLIDLFKNDLLAFETASCYYSARNNRLFVGSFSSPSKSNDEINNINSLNVREFNRKRGWYLEPTHNFIVHQKAPGVIEVIGHFAGINENGMSIVNALSSSQQEIVLAFGMQLSPDAISEY